MNNDYQAKKMQRAQDTIDPKGNIVLQEFDNGAALLFQPGAVQPFCVADGYERSTGSWSSGSYFSDPASAYDYANPEIIAEATVKWEKEDIREKLEAWEIEPSDRNVQVVIDGDRSLWERPLDKDFRDNMIASGDEDLSSRIECLKDNGKFSIPDTAAPVTNIDELNRKPCTLSEKATATKDSFEAQYDPDEQGRIFDRPCEVLDNGSFNEH